ncbi:MAG TPA: glycosyltransferase [Candidatus Paceibacterota bacterium]|jgi:glycosyltransferase involved in cell wall biosynthesis
MPRDADRIRVAFVINDLLLGGAQQVVLAIASGLDRTRFEPYVYYLNEYPPERPSLRQAFESAAFPLRYIGTGGKTPIARAIPRLVRAFRTDRPHVVHTHLVDATLSGAFAARLAGVRSVVVHEHQTHAQYSSRIRLAYRLIRPFVTLTVCYAPAVEEELFGKAVVLERPPERLTRRSYTVRNGIDATRPAPQPAVRAHIRNGLGIPEEAIVVISVTRLVVWKGARVLLEAAARVMEERPELHLCFVGEGALAGELATRAKELGIAPRVHLLGARTDAGDLLNASDIASIVLLYPPGIRGETVGIAGLEAMAAGLPLIAARSDDPHALLKDGETGVLVAPGDAEALAHALAMLVDGPEKRQAVAARGRALAGNFDWPELLSIYARIYTVLTRR